MCDLFCSYGYIKLCIKFYCIVTIIKNINFEYISWLPQYYWARSATATYNP